MTPQERARYIDSLYNSFEYELHDLVIRTPYTFAPGNYGRCSLPDSQEEYDPEATYYRPNNVLARHGRNALRWLWKEGESSADWVPIRTDDEEETPSPEDSAVWRVGIEGVDHADAVTGMTRCTNKIRATLSKTCSHVDEGPIEGGIYGCSQDDDCRSPVKYDLVAKYDYDWQDVVCDGPPEPERTGRIDVLEGAEGAYLFCYHPEDPNRGSDCGNFVLPPQSAFIVARSGQYDVLVSKYRMLVDGVAHMPSCTNNNPALCPLNNDKSGFTGHNALSIRTWLKNRNATIRIYDEFGLAEEIGEPSWTVDNSEASGSHNGDLSHTFSWSWGDGGPHHFHNDLDEEMESAFTDWQGFIDDYGMDWNHYIADRYYKMEFPHKYSPVWTPVSINSQEGIKVWWGGNYGADYRYFSDLLHSDTWLFFWSAGWGLNKYRTCACSAYTDGSGNFVRNVPDYFSSEILDRFNVSEPYAAIGICSGPGYANPDNAPDRVACTNADKIACPADFACHTNAANNNVRCVKLCNENSDCQPNSNNHSGANFCVKYYGRTGINGEGCCGAGTYEASR